jgi:hypothetical protein
MREGPFMLTGPRSLDTFSPFHGWGPSTSKKKEKPKRKIDWSKEIDHFTKEAQKRPSNGTRQIDITVSIGYLETMDAILPVVKRVLRETNEILQDPEAEIALGDMDPTDIKIHIRPFCHKDDYWDAVMNLVKNLKYTFFSEGISYKSVKSNS